MAHWWSCFGDFASSRWGYPDRIELFKEYLELSGKSDEDVAEACGIKEAMVRHMRLYGEGMDSVKRLRDISKACEIPPELFGLAPEEPKEDLRHLVCRLRILRNWTQEQLAHALGVHPKTVSAMENKGSSLDSLERRRALRFILGIPPALLGLDASHVDPLSELPKPPRLALIRVVQENLWTGYYTSHAQDQVAAARHAVTMIEASLPSLSSAEHPAWLEQQSLLHQGLANVTREYATPKKVLSYAEEAVSAAKESGNTDLISVALMRQMETAYVLGDEKLAVKLAEVYEQTPVDNPVVRSVRSIASARVLALAATDEAGRTRVRSLMDQFPVFGQTYHLSHKKSFVIRQAQTLLNLASLDPRDVSFFLARADRLLTGIDPGTLAPTHLRDLNLTQAQVALACGVYDQAVKRVVEAHPLMDTMQSTLDLPKFAEIYRTLRQNKYASPDMEHLRRMLIRDNAISYDE